MGLAAVRLAGVSRDEARPARNEADGLACAGSTMGHEEARHGAASGSSHEYAGAAASGATTPVAAVAARWLVGAVGSSATRHDDAGAVGSSESSAARHDAAGAL